MAKRKTRAEKLQEKGFNYFKVELEANLGIEDGECDYCNGSGEQECCECYGSGDYDCDTCNGNGTVEGTNDEGELVDYDCEDCNGSGRVDCDYCDGRGYFNCDCDGSYRSEDSPDLWEFGETYKNNMPEDMKNALVFFECYDDGSVDTEITLTLPVEFIDRADMLVSAFEKTCKGYNLEIDDSNAGLHISISGEGNPEASQLDKEKLANFTREVSKLLTGFYIVASKGFFTRPYGYRLPQVSDEHKYSAIFTHHRSFLEYRIFDTCYGDSKRILDFVDAIIGSLKYYSKSRNGVDKFGEQILSSSRNLKEAISENHNRACRELEYLVGKSKSKRILKVNQIEEI